MTKKQVLHNFEMFNDIIFQNTEFSIEQNTILRMDFKGKIIDIPLQDILNSNLVNVWEKEDFVKRVLKQKIESEVM